MEERMMYGYMALVDTSCGDSFQDIIKVFIPTEQVEKARKMASEGGTIVCMGFYAVDYNKLSEIEKVTITDRLIELQGERYR